MSARNSQVQVPCMPSIKNEPSSVDDLIKYELQQSIWKHEQGVKLEFNSQDVTCSIKQDPDMNSVNEAKTEERLVFKQEKDPSNIVKLEHATHIEQSDCKCESTLKLEYHFQCANCSIKPEQDFVHRIKTEEQIVIKEEQEGSQKEKMETERHAIWQNDSNEKCHEMSVHRCNAHEVMDNVESQQNKTHSDVQLHPHQCSLCPATFKCSKSLKRHMLVHSDERSHQCSLCKAAFKRSSHLKRHMLVHSDVKPIQCTLCKAAFKSSSLLKKHMVVHSDERSYQCSLCKAHEVMDINAENQENQTHSYAQLHPRQCSLCKATFKCSKNLKRHMLVHSDERSHECSLCKAAFKRSSCLKVHMLVHSDVKPFQCSLCKSTFKSSSHLKQHMMVHSDVNPHQCSLCPATFKCSRSLKRHMLAHSDQRSHQCSLCKAAFKRSSCLKNHMLAHSGQRSYQCSLCKAAFKSSSHLKRHMLVHSDERSYQCSLCKATFKRSNHLKRHMLVHSSE